MPQQVDVYHDETHLHGWRGHCLLFVPTVLAKHDSLPLFGPSLRETSPSELFLERLVATRKHCRLTQRKLHFTDISGGTWSIRDLGFRLIADLLVDALRHRNCSQFSSPLCFKGAAMLYADKGPRGLYGGRSRNEQQ